MVRFILFHFKRHYIGFLLAVSLPLFWMGCTSTEEFKTQADEDVYKILDQKWQDEFGYKPNYKVMDAEPNIMEQIQMIPPSGMLSQALAVEMATKYSRSYQSQKESLYLSTLSLSLTRHNYARQWFGTVDAAYQSTTDSDTVSAETGFSQTNLIGDGIRVTTGLAVDWARFFTGDPGTTLGSVLTGTISAPLLGSGAGKSARESLTQAERSLLYRIRTFSRYRKTFAVSVISDYFRVLQEENRLQIQKASYKRLVDSTNQLRMEVDVGKRPAYDLAEAEQRLLSGEQSVISAVQRYEQTLDNFKISLALPTDIEIHLDPNELRTLESLGVSEPEFSAEDAILMALEFRLDLANTRDSLDDTERKLILAAEGLGTQIDLTASANVQSTPDTQVTRLRFNDGVYSAAIAADLPFDRKSERNNYIQALISVQQQQRDYDEQVDNIKLAVRDSYRNLIQTAESYRIQQIGLKLAEKRVEVEKLSLQYGRGTVRLLLNSEDALVQAQDDVLSALVNHMIAKLNFLRDVGILRVRPDGMWEQAKL